MRGNVNKRRAPIDRCALIVALVPMLLTSGCVRFPHAMSPDSPDAPRALPPGVIAMRDAEGMRSRIPTGESTRADVTAALGKAPASLRFDSGYEVWLYRIRPAENVKHGDTEWVMLFDPSGRLVKQRQRPPPVPPN